MGMELETNQAGLRRQLHVEFDVEPSPDHSCPVTSRSENDILEIRQQFVGHECHTDVKIVQKECDCSPERECAEVVHATRTIDSTCPCPVFGRFNCVHDVVDVSDGRVRYVAYLPNRELLTRLISDLRDVTSSLHLRRLKRIDEIEGDDRSGTVSLNLLDVTEKQREAAVAAVTAGYYGPNQETSLEELAADLDISKSALSQRLSAVEAKLVTDAYSESGDG